MKLHNKNLGNDGELLIAQQLKSEGYTIIAHNYRTRTGEVDLIAQYGDTIAFIEVKTRSNQYGDLSEVITISKQKKICMAARQYIAEHNINDKVCRFDVALIEYINHQPQPKIQYISNAFEYE